MSLPIYKYRQWAKIFRKGGAVYLGQDSRNHRIWVYTPKGDDKPLTAGIAAHSEGSDVLPVYINQARKFWKLRSSDGVSDHDFLNGNWS